MEKRKGLKGFLSLFGRGSDNETASKRIAGYGITEEEYRKEKYDLLTDRDLDKLMTDPVVSGKVDYVADRYKVSRGEVYARAAELKKEYKISLNRFLQDDLFPVHSDEKLRAVRESMDKAKKRQLNSLADVTGMDSEEEKEYVAHIKDKFGVDVAFIKNHELFKKSDEEISEYLAEYRQDNAKRRERIKREMNWTDFDLERSLAFCRYRYHVGELSAYDNIRFWAYPREVLDTFAVKQDSLDLKKSYNTVSTKILSNKIRFDNKFREFIGRKFWVNKDTSFEEFCEFIDGLDKVFCKPINLCAGKGCYLYPLSGDAEKDYEYFINEPKMLIEEVPKQHHLINEIYDKSINTVRVAAVIKEGEFIPFFAWIKFGAKGSIVDGRAGGGCFAGVDVKTGIVDTLAIDKDNNRFDKHVDTGKPITGFRVPYWPEVLDLAERALRHVDGINYVGWDICITEDGPIIIEGNSAPSLVDMQLLYGYGEHEGEGQRYRYIDLLEDPDKWRRV